MSESVHAPPPRQAAEPDAEVPTDMPTGLLAALVTRLADHLLIRRVVRRVCRSRTSRRRGPGRPRWGALTARQSAWADSMSLKAIATPAAREPGPLVTRVRSLTVAKVDSIGLPVRRWIQCSRHFAPYSGEQQLAARSDRPTAVTLTAAAAQCRVDSSQSMERFAPRPVRLRAHVMAERRLRPPPRAQPDRSR
jgi:hypothetical protein